MLDALLWGAVSGGIALVTGRSTGETIASAVAGVAAGAFVGGLEASDKQQSCYKDILEFLIVTGEADTFNFDKEGFITIRSSTPEMAWRVRGTMTRCNPKDITQTNGGRVTRVEI